VTWAAGALAPGSVADVQVRRPGSGSWATLEGSTDQGSVFFVADAGSGRYAFRARLRDPLTGAASGWSPPAHVSIS
jgi:hypothetical protein